ncbi:hypothetical protein ACJJTC_012029, partial [Scirpophaga incertulas]
MRHKQIVIQTAMIHNEINRINDFDTADALSIDADCADGRCARNELALSGRARTLYCFTVDIANGVKFDSDVFQRPLESNGQCEPTVRGASPAPSPETRNTEASFHSAIGDPINLVTEPPSFYGVNCCCKSGVVAFRLATVGQRGQPAVPRLLLIVTLVVNLALVIYHALDYQHSEDEERLISPDLEGLITEMTACDDVDDDEECGILSEGSETSEGGRADTDDEGIERDAEPAPRRRRRRRRFMLRDVIERCVWHCGGGGRGVRDAAAAHYRAVCRALVAEALELASFLARVRVGGARDLGAAEDSATHLDTLHFSDWARFWMQVIGELRMGVKLKKVNYSRTPIEYELTPYEILMDDIRSRRYTLRKVDGAIPQSVKKDAHAMILEFIRSRPPLKK